MTANIAKDLLPLAVPVGNVKPLAGNPRKGDVQAVAKSLSTFGQRKPIVVRRMKKQVDGHPTGEVIAGNHTLLAALSLGWESIAVTWTDDDTKTAKAFALADNKTHDLGTYDDGLLAEMVADLSATPLLEAASFDEDEVQRLLAMLPDPDAPADTAEGSEGGQSRGLGNPIIQYQIIFDTEEQQQKWFEFVRWLRTEFPDADTNAERIVNYLRRVLP